MKFITRMLGLSGPTPMPVMPRDVLPYNIQVATIMSFLTHLADVQAEHGRQTIDPEDVKQAFNRTRAGVPR